MKRGIRYLRFSHDGQSQHSIERQETITGQWMKFNKVDIVDTFTDEGYTARNFDRPDIKELFAFIKKNYHGINYLVVSELTRFSREAGDAINMVKKIQATYDIRIVSASRGAVYDCLDANSFFMMGLEFLLGNSENIKRQNDVNGGIYTAKAIKGKWIRGGKRPPYGYKIEGTGQERRLIVDRKEAVAVRQIYEDYLANIPVYFIRQRAEELGFYLTGHSSIMKILKNPIYCGYQYVKAWKENPGGLFPMKDHESIVDAMTWHAVQEKVRGIHQPKKLISDELPLRGVLRCHCGLLLTGAPSRGKLGKYYYYYKCNRSSSHNNISAIKAHTQLEEMLGYMSLPDKLIKKIQDQGQKTMEAELKLGKELLQEKKKEYDDADAQLKSVEEKLIRNQIAPDTYNRWHTELTQKKASLREHIDRLSHNNDGIFELLKNELGKLGDLQSIYTEADTLEKQELIRLVFDSRLYYKNGIYRTPYMLELFHHNVLILKEKRLLELDENEKRELTLPLRAGGGTRTPMP